MASFIVKLVPDEINIGTESYLDTSVSSGLSKQRTVNVTNTVNSGGVSVMHVAVADGGSFSDTPETLLNVAGIIED
jgi:hypothetical protein